MNKFQDQNNLSDYQRRSLERKKRQEQKKINEEEVKEFDDLWKRINYYLTSAPYILDLFKNTKCIEFILLDTFLSEINLGFGEGSYFSISLEQQTHIINYSDFLNNKYSYDPTLNENFFTKEFFEAKNKLKPKLYEEIKDLPDLRVPKIPKQNILDWRMYDSNFFDEEENIKGDIDKINQKRINDFYSYDIEQREKIRAKYEKFILEYKSFSNNFEINKDKIKKYFKDLNDKVLKGNETAITERLLLHIKQNEIFYKFIDNHEVTVSLEKSVVLIELSLINFDYEWISYSGKNENIEKPTTHKEKEAILQKFVKLISIRTLFASTLILNNSDIETLCINIKQKWTNPALGIEEEGVTSSLQVKKDGIKNINIEKIDPEKTFRHFRGIHAPSIFEPTKIRPIIEFDKTDSRIIETSDVLGQMDESQNLALMDWEDFEHLVAQLFQLEFANDGSEVNVTQSSRDKGVDAIVFDPNPLKGGKYILQAKRYTNVVGVSAVRDLYGTIMNEGANRGILITTSTYGSDSYEFAKNKPISLVDGSNLLSLLQKHNMKFKIDLLEARNLLDSKKLY